MRTKLIMLPNPILASDEGSKKGEWTIFPNTLNGYIESFKGCVPKKAESDYSQNGVYNLKVIAGIEGLPKLDLSAIAEQIGWIDVEELAESHYRHWYTEYDVGRSYRGFIHGFKAAQSLNEKKFTLADIQDAWDSGKHYGQTECEFYNTDSVRRTEYNRCETKEQFIESLSKPKEYDVEVEMEWSGKEYVDEQDAYGYDIKRPKITNNTIKVTKII